MNAREFYWKTNKNFFTDILRYEFGSQLQITDSSYKNDECPSLTLNLDNEIFLLYLPSDYKGEFSEYMLMYCTGLEDDEYCNSDTHWTYNSIAEVIKKIDSYL